MSFNNAVPQSLKREIMEAIYKNRMFLTSLRDREEGWTLHSGIWSPFYIQLRLLSSFPELLRKVAKAMSIVLNENAPHITRVVGIAFAGIPLATALSLESGLPACYTRKIPGIRTETELRKYIHEYGQHSLVEGIISEGDSLCLIDDLVTGLESKLIARTQVLSETRNRGLSNVSCDDILVLIDRQQGAYDRARKAGLTLRSVIGLIDEGLPFLKDIMTPQEFETIINYLIQYRHR